MLAHMAGFHAATMGLPCVFTEHSLLPLSHECPAACLLNTMSKFTQMHCSQYICVSHCGKENLVARTGIAPHRVHVIPNAVNESEFTPPPMPILSSFSESNDVANLDKKANQVSSHDTRFRVLVLSRLVYRKGIDLLAQVLPLLLKFSPEIVVIIGGEGEKRSSLEAVIATHKLSDRVKLLGKVPHNQTRSLMNSCDVFLNCSLTEAFCITVLEAAFVGLPIVATRVGGIPEVLPPRMINLCEPSVGSIFKTLLRVITEVKNARRTNQIECSIPNGSEGYGKRHFSRVQLAGVENAIGVGNESPNVVVSLRELKRRWEQHNRLRRMYCWANVAERTEIVYRKAISAKSPISSEPIRTASTEATSLSVIERMRRSFELGGWIFGPLLVCMVAADMILLAILRVVRPASVIEPAPDYSSKYRHDMSAA
jgi:glycosyltransferase involved in cell wall biosynthesis